MNDINQHLEVFHQESVGELEEARFARLTRGQSQANYREVSEASTSTLRPMSISRESTPTVNGDMKSNLEMIARSSLGDPMELDSPQEPDVAETSENEEPLIIATDFGTTFSTVAFARRRKGKREKVEVISNYEGDNRSWVGLASLQVPTESLYPDKSQIQNTLINSESHEQDDDPYSNLYDDTTGEENPNVDGGFDEDNAMEVQHDQISDETTSDFVWGYEIHELIQPDVDLSNFNRITKSKLLLDNSPRTQSVRDELRPILAKLKNKTKKPGRRNVYKTDEDIIADYLTQLLLHTKKELTTHFNVPNGIAIEHVLTVPVIWNAKACRTMQSAMETAIRNSGLGTINGLFLVSEPEAAAAFIIGKDNEVFPEEKFLILDAGGGTVDATTYQLTQEYPLRLSEELVNPDGRLNGSSFLNAGFRRHLIGRLTDERADIEQNGSTLEGLVDVAVLLFEQSMKRSIDVTNNQERGKKIHIPGLRQNTQKNFRNNYVQITLSNFRDIFMPHLEAIAGLMKDQLTLAKEAGHEVKKIVLIGGFSGSTSLQHHLARRLGVISRAFGYQIRLTRKMDISEPESAVAVGAVLRALDKENGPQRITKSSYGFLRTEPYEPLMWKAHAETKPTIDQNDGEKYVVKTIYWLICKNEPVPFHKEHSIIVIHTIPTNRKRLLCEELLYVSDNSTESHYRRDHAKNKGCEIAGRIVADMSFLRDKKIIQPIGPGRTWKRHYRIEYQLVMVVDGRNLRYEARWPVGGTVRGRGQTSIAAAFKPGTK